MTNNGFGDKPFKLTIIEGGYAIIGYAIIGAILMALQAKPGAEEFLSAHVFF